MVLADGTILELERGAHPSEGRRVDLETRRGRVTIAVPSYVMPRVPKHSAGYYAAPGMDLIDLFIGSEGTLGIITQVTFRVLSPAPQTALALIPCTSDAQGFALAGALRAASFATWRSNDAAGIDAGAIEHMDRRSLDILREDGVDAMNDVRVPEGTQLALLVQLELPAGTTAESAYADIGSALDDGGTDTSLGRFCRLLDEAGLLETTELAMPGDRRRADQLIAIREGVPTGVNQRVGRAKRDIDPRIEKTAADMIVPFDRFGEMAEIYRRGFEARGLDYAIWGHLSDGNVHPNVIPRTYDDVQRGKDAMLEFGREVARLGGCPLAEHGVGRNPVKQELLRQLYGDDGVEQMRAVKRALDPAWKLAPGVIFAPAHKGRLTSRPYNAGGSRAAPTLFVFIQVLLRVLVEARLADRRTEIIRLPLVVALSCRGLLVNHHSAHGVFRHIASIVLDSQHSCIHHLRLYEHPRPDFPMAPPAAARGGR